MSRKLIITHLFEKIITALYEEDSLVELSCEEIEAHSILDNIYIGKVKNIVKNINAAFIEIADGQMCYYSFEDNKNPIITNRTMNLDKNTVNIRQGDELLVQVSKEAVKTKDPMVTSNLNLAGRYSVLTTGNTRIGISSKIKEPRRSQVKEIFAGNQSEEYGFVIRTNAATATNEVIQAEIKMLKERYQKLIETARYRTCYSLLYETEASYLLKIRDVYSTDLSEIITDDSQIYEQIHQFLREQQWEGMGKLRFYEDEKYPLAKLYNLESQIKDGLTDKVWLKSGGYLVIQQAEACTIIDVNSGKFSGHKKMQQTFFYINQEAAKEAARQIRLRNISGIILIDFIDMNSEEERKKLLLIMDEYVRTDPIPTSVVDMTALQIMELTRKKVRRTLKEQLSRECPVCHGRGFLY